MSPVAIAFAATAAVLLDALLGEPRRAHPLVAFGRMAQWIEARLHADRRANGVLAWSLAVLPAVLLCAVLVRALAAWPWVQAAASTLVLYLALGLRSLGEHARPVAVALDAGDLDRARGAVGRMVSRDTAALSRTQVAAAATESVLENGNDAVFGALFWFVLLGAPGVVLYRLANTLDAMWGYRTPRYARFGCATARIDDALNFVPARLTALTYALLGKASSALRCWRTQAWRCDSPNAGPVMAAGAGALRVRLGGAAPYHGRWETRPELGEGDAPDARSIRRALRLVRNAAVLWLLAMLGIAAITELSNRAISLSPACGGEGQGEGASRSDGARARHVIAEAGSKDACSFVRDIGALMSAASLAPSPQPCPARRSAPGAHRRAGQWPAGAPLRPPHAGEREHVVGAVWRTARHGHA